ncbi:hypothetical protein [Natronobacterium gregoryi]|uniref:Uncharacterized protein n=2 Tax=Natronobacterium gregoryi TaxID=44930 RepID=L0AES4_NATGS|nr:hypothetical protein [Natronobacterium gregoryi]AFZ72341.1 hypothetical protein Natgr_1113 [Natronobacterium gregoryi SP2]ELY64273.1 hypothetical protein C490_14830 [Natronobacterium gregoryi SP2]PLK20342.1 hypothetical protein CYV19_10290 [Natronobacterium gregoryi SP2]SFJ23104.1 hypothetical protein SAMN05443661_11856 [Natronobacterium gregoryi]
MSRRTIALIIGLLIVAVAVSTALMITYPSSYESPHSANSDSEMFTLELEDAFHLTGAVETDGEEFIEYEAVLTEDGERYEYYTTDDMVRETYREEPDGELYRMYRYADEKDAESYQQRIETTYESRTIVDEAQEGDEIRFLVIEEDPDEFHGTIDTTETMLLNGIRTLPTYERVASDDSASVYEPQEGWYNTSGELSKYRITDASGHVTVAPETYSVESADVSVQYMAVSTYLDYLWGTEEVQSIQTTIDVADDPTVTEPEWVDEIRDEQ